MKRFFLILIVMLLTGCTSGCTPASLLEQLPDSSFESFSYKRSGTAPASITASNGQLTDGALVIEDVHIQLDYPWMAWDIEITGYRRSATAKGDAE